MLKKGHSERGDTRPDVLHRCCVERQIELAAMGEKSNMNYAEPLAKYRGTGLSPTKATICFVPLHSHCDQSPRTVAAQDAPAGKAEEHAVPNLRAGIFS